MHANADFSSSPPSSRRPSPHRGRAGLLYSGNDSRNIFCTYSFPLPIGYVTVLDQGPRRRGWLVQLRPFSRDTTWKPLTWYDMAFDFIPTKSDWSNTIPSLFLPDKSPSISFCGPHSVDSLLRSFGSLLRPFTPCSVHLQPALSICAMPRPSVASCCVRNSGV